MSDLVSVTLYPPTFLLFLLFCFLPVLLFSETTHCFSSPASRSRPHPLTLLRPIKLFRYYGNV